MAAVAAAVIPTLDQRPIKNTICLFDVDDTLTPARRVSDECRRLSSYRDDSSGLVVLTAFVGSQP